MGLCPALIRVPLSVQDAAVTSVASSGGSMFNHIMVGTNDIERAQRFYDAVLGTLGVDPAMRNVATTGHVRLFYRHDGNAFSISQPIDDAPATAGNGGTIGFKCTSIEQLHLFYDTAVAAGGMPIEDLPGLRDGSVGPIYLAYVRDPDGNKLCAVYREPKAA